MTIDEKVPGPGHFRALDGHKGERYRHPWVEDSYRGSKHVYPINPNVVRERTRGQAVTAAHPKCALCREGTCEQVVYAETFCHQRMA